MKTETSHIWLGLFSDNAPADFFVERYDREDDEPLSPFSESQGEIYYDHDFVEISYLNSPVNIAELVEGHSYSEQYLDSVLVAARAAEISTANVLVLASEDQFPSATMATGEGYKLWHLGKFTYNI